MQLAVQAVLEAVRRLWQLACSSPDSRHSLGSAASYFPKDLWLVSVRDGLIYSTVVLYATSRCWGYSLLLRGRSLFLGLFCGQSYKSLSLSLFKITYLWLCWVFVATCGLSPVVVKRGYSWVAVVLTAMTSPVVELGSRVTGFRSCGSWALEGGLRATVHQLSYHVLCVGRWVLHHWANREALSLSSKVKIWHNFIMVLPIKIQGYGFLCL